jgi:hypothetical protein
MKISGYAFGAAVLALTSAPIAAAQSPADSTALAPAHQLLVDVSGVGLDLGFARRTTPHSSLGLSIGVGGNWANYMLIAGGHFAEAGGLAYAPKDGASSKEMFELVRASLFSRHYFASGRQLDLGLKVSTFLHLDTSDDDPGAGAFIGLAATPIWKRWGHLALGSEIDAGAYLESSATEFGINVAPAFIRISIP